MLPLRGDNGTVYCRVAGQQQSTIPMLSPNNRIECVTRSWLRLRNLVAVRGDPTAYMIGPCEYFQNLECPHTHKYTTCNGTQWFHASENLRQDSNPQKYAMSLRVPQNQWQWRSHTDSGYNTQKSLFPDSGTLTIPVDVLRLPRFSAINADLRPFKVRLVRNDKPFCITKDELPTSDEYRVVTYEYHPDYHLRYPEYTFLERHSFAQTMTPTNKNCGGYVVVGAVEGTGHLRLAAIRIPFGYTLIVDPFAIHGDNTLAGIYAMAMTSNHLTMQKADTVFLKSPAGNPICFQRHGHRQRCIRLRGWDSLTNRTSAMKTVFHPIEWFLAATGL